MLALIEAFICMASDVTKLIDLTSSGVPVQAEMPPVLGHADSIPKQILNTNLGTNAENGTV